MRNKGWRGRLQDFVHVTDYVANGSFASLKANVEYKDSPAHAILVRTVDFKRGWSGEYVWVDKHAYDFLEKSSLVPGDLVISNVGASVGTAFRVPDLGVPLTLGPNAVLCRPLDPGKLDRRFLYYYFTSSIAQDAIQSIVSGSAQPKFNKGSFRTLQVHFPPIAHQQAIASVLGALDDKIELNRRMSETLHQIAESTFKDMFLPSAIGASEISEVAESTIGDEIDVTMGQSPPGSTYNTEGQGLPFYQGRTDFGMLFPTRRVYCTAPTRLAREGDTLLSVRAPVGDVNVAVEDCAIGRGVAALRHRSGSRVFTYFLARSLHATFDQFNGEGTVFGSISKKALLGLACPKPSDSQLHAFEKIGGPILLRLRSAMQESDTLISIRDALLPKLISGELRIPQAEQLVSEVV